MTEFGTALLGSVQKSFAGYLMSDKELARLSNRVRDGTDYQDANEYAARIGELLAKSIDDNTKTLAFMSRDVAQEVLTPLLTENHDIVAQAAATVQKNMNDAAGIGMGVLTADLDTNRINGLIDKVASYDTYEQARWVLNEPVVNYSQAVVDQTIRKNAQAHYKAGFEPIVIRKTEAAGTKTRFRKIKGRSYKYTYAVPCKWCAGLEGVYKYSEVKNTGNDVFRRHEACRCIIIYKDANKTVNVRTQKEWTGEDADSIAQRINGATQMQAPKPIPQNAISNAYGDEAYRKMQEVAANGEENTRKFWEKNEKYVGVAETGRTDGRAWCDWQHKIHLSLKTEMNPVRLDELPFEVTFHEGFHAIDMHYGLQQSGRNYTMFSAIWENGKFPATIEKEVQKLVKDRGTAIQSMMAADDVDGLKNLFGVRGYRNWFYYGVQGTKYRKEMAYKVLEYEVRQLSDVERGRLSNVLSGATKGKINCGYGHANSYWSNGMRNGVNTNLACEAAAEFFDTSMSNKTSLETMKRYLPESYNVFCEMLEDMGNL